jgi:hypothetical protein
VALLQTILQEPEEKVMFDSKRAAAVLGVLALGLLTVGAGPAREQGTQEVQSITFNMLAQHVGTGPSGQTPVIIQVTRLSTPDERDALEEVFKSQGMQALADALRDAPDVGFIRAPRVSNTGWRLHYAMVYSDGKGGRIFRLATDRPISFVEAVNRPQRSWDYNVSLVELHLDANGEGSGTLVAGVEFSYDETNDTFGLKSISSEPIRLVNVRTEVK